MQSVQPHGRDGDSSLYPTEISSFKPCGSSFAAGEFPLNPEQVDPVMSAGLMRPEGARIWLSRRLPCVSHHTGRQLVSECIISRLITYYRRGRGRIMSFVLSCNISILVSSVISFQISAFLQESAGELICQNMSSLLSLTPVSGISPNCS